MRVPVKRTPDTQVDTGQLGFARPAMADASPIAQGLAGLNEGIRALQEEQIEARRKAQKFELNKRLLEEQERLRKDYVERLYDPNRSINSFADTNDQEWQDQHVGQLDELWQKGFDRDLLEDYSGKLGGLRDGFFAQGLAHQAKTLGVRAVTETEQYLTLGSQVVASSPESYAQVRDQTLEQIDLNPFLLPEQKDQLKEQAKRTLRGTGAKSIAELQTERVFELLDPEGLWRASQAQQFGNVTGPAASVVAKPGSWQGVAVNVANDLGLDPAQVAAVMSFETAGTMDPNISGGDGGRYLGLIQFGPEEQRKYGIVKGSTPEQWTAAILGFMKDRGFKPGMGIEDFYSTILTGGPGRYDRRDSNGTSVRNAIPRILAEHGPKAQAWLAQGIETIDPGPNTAPEQPLPAVQQAPIDPNRVFSVTDAQTGDPLLDDLTGEERLQVLGWALQKEQKAKISEAAAMDVLVDNIQSELLNNAGETAQPMPSDEELIRVYGPIKGPQVAAQLQQTANVGRAVGQFYTLDPTTMNQRVEALKPKPGSPTYAVEEKLYSAAADAAGRIMDEREADPAAFAMKYYPSLQRAAKQGTTQYYKELDRIVRSWGMDPEGISPLPEAAVDKLAEDFKFMGPQQKFDWMQQNFSTMGEDRFQRFVTKLKGTGADKEARIYALLREAPGSRTTLKQIFEGMEALRKDPSRRPKFNQLRTKFREGVGSALFQMDPNASGAVQEAAAAFYVYSGGDPDNIDSKLYKESLQVALGGREIMEYNKNVHWGVEKVKDATILPPGVNATQWENWIESRGAGDLTRLSLRKKPPVYADLKTPATINEIIDNGVFVMYAPDLYRIRMADSGGFLKTEDGKNFVVRIRPRDVK